MNRLAQDGSLGSNSDEINLLDLATPWYQTSAGTIALGMGGALLVAFLALGIHSWQMISLQHRTDLYLNAYAQAKTPAEQLQVLHDYSNVPETAIAYLQLGADAMKSGDYADAREAFAAAAERNPQLAPGAWLGEAQALDALDKNNEAVTLLKKIVTNPRDANNGARPAALILLAQFRAEKKDIAGARQALEDLLSHCPESAFVPQAKEMLAGLR